MHTTIMKSTTVKTSWKDRIFKRLGLALSLGTIAFVFEACYGIPPDRRYQEEFISGIVQDADGIPLSGVELLVDSSFVLITDEEGRFHSFVPIYEEHTISIENVIDTTVSAQDGSDLVLVVKL